LNDRKGFNLKYHDNYLVTGAGFHNILLRLKFNPK